MREPSRVRHPVLQGYPIERGRVVIGLISGTSADGIDAALVRLPAVGAPSALEFLAFKTLPYPPDVRDEVGLAAKDHLSLRRSAVLSTRLGHLFAEAALAVMPTDGVDLVASHGQTVCHIPQQATTWQLGEASVIALKTGVPTVADFRPADLACGGQGAPLVPLFDAWVLGDPSIRRIAVNLGGIANLTVIPRQVGEPVLAWDTGPANCLSDAACRLSGVGFYDASGLMARDGQVQPELLVELLKHPYLAVPRPKSTGLEDFGEELAASFLGRASLSDLLRTFVAFSAETLARDLQSLVQSLGDPVIELVFAGGGVANLTLMAEIENRLTRMATTTDWRFRSFSEFGVPEDGREAAAFAYLGDLTARGLPGALPQTTGARQAAVLGRVSFPPKRHHRW